MLKSCPFSHHLPGLKWFLWVPFIFLFDQISKWLVVQQLAMGQTKEVLPGLQLVLAHNYGIAFSLFQQQNNLGKFLLIITIVAISLFIALGLAKTSSQEKWTGWALTFILGGALGNLADRFRYGYVIDFIDCSIKGWHWYTFNLADVFISLGAAMLVKNILFNEK